MREHLVHHLPVLDGDSVMGMLSDRDVEVAESVGGPSGFDGTTVAAVMTRHPYVVEPDAPLEQVVQELVARRYGSALVVSGGQVVGIFTGTDALQAFADVLTGRIPKPMD
jgi:CBS domain-containing protein